MSSKYLTVCGPSVIWFHLKSKIKDVKDAKKLLSMNEYLINETSYGSPHSKLDCYPEVGIACHYDSSDFSDKTPGIFVRLSIGFQSDSQTVIRGLKDLFEKNIKFYN